MAISEQRLSLFALISEFEADARELIASYVCDDHSIKDDVGPETFAYLNERAARAFNEGTIDERLLITFMDVGDAIRTLLSNRTLFPPNVSRSLTTTAKQLESLPAIRNRVMHRRPIEFDDLPLVTDTMRSLTRTSAKEFARTKAVLVEMAEGQRFVKFEKAFAYDSEPTVLNNLPQPDFEDTGFMGRREQIEELKKAIKGPYPVITVLGVGGAGKSALALNVAYDILNSPNCEFDAIIWTTAKTTRLTGADVEAISGAISSSIGIAEAALRELGELPGDDPFIHLQELLSHFKILLFIDNLETILDDRVREFVRNIPVGSKIVFTSRIGLGAYDFVVPIKNLVAKEAANYFRRVAAVWKQTELLQASKEDVSSYLVRLNHSPLGIKWFVQAVSSGASAQRLLSNPAALLMFCLENIIDKLSTEAKACLNALGVTGREQSTASLHYLTNIEPWSVEDALRELIGSHLITVVTSKFGEEDRYKIAPISQTYLSRLHAPSAAVQAAIHSRQGQLTQMAERAEAEHGRGYVYDPSYVTVRPEFSGTDSVAANYLRRAMSAARQGRYDDAFAEIEDAKTIAPSFFEVMRVEGFISATQGNTMRAQGAYEEARALKPNHPPLLVLFAGFLIRSLGNGGAAEQIMRQALAIDSEAPELRMELARTLIYQHEFEEAWQVLRQTDTKLLKNGRSWRMLCDLLVQTCTRSAEDYFAEGSALQFGDSMQRLQTVLAEMPSYAVDEYTEGHLRSVSALCSKFLRREGQTPTAESVGQVMETIAVVLGYPSQSLGVQAQLQGRINNLSVDKLFGFIQADDGNRLFFHRNNLKDRSHFGRLVVGTTVGFSLGSNSQGQCADEVFIIS